MLHKQIQKTTKKWAKKLLRQYKNVLAKRINKGLVIFIVCWAVCGIVALCGYFDIKSSNVRGKNLVSNALPKTLQSSIKIPPPLQIPLYFDVSNTQKSAHASAIVNIEKLGLRNEKDEILQDMLLYFAGSREGASDVCIYQSFFAKHSNALLSQMRKKNPNNYKELFFWSDAEAILCPKDLSKMSNKFIKKLGNPVSFVDTKAQVHLFVVGVSMGGWATSKIYWLKFKHQLKGVEFVRELALSPILNFSNLVRNPAMLLENGDFVLPIYNEFAQKYPLLLYIDSKDNKIESMFKPISSYATSKTTRNQLQPSFVALDSSAYFGVFRQYRGDNIMQSALCENVRDDKKITNNNECKILPSNLKNFDFSPVVFKIDFGQESAVLLLQNSAKSPKGNPREELWLYKLKSNLADSSLQQVDFVPIMKIDELEGREVSYPSVAYHSDYLHISYTYGREHITTVVLPKGYVLKKLKETK